jgi:hypothetical protein
VTEREVKRQAYALLRGFGCFVYDTSQNRPSRVALGLPDAWVFLPFGKGGFWYEAKGDGGVQRPEQARFQERCAHGTVGYVLGGLPELRAYLGAVGVL